jgi:hypothetical protein
MNSIKAGSLLILWAVLAAASCAAPPKPAAAPGGKLLLHAVLKPLNPDSLGAPGEQSLTQQLVLIDLSQRRVLAQKNVEPETLVAYSETTRSIWTANRSRKEPRMTHLNELRVDDLQPLNSFLPAFMTNVPTDPSGMLLSNPGLAVVGPRQVVLEAQVPDSVGSDFLRITVTSADQLTYEELGVARQDVAGIVQGVDGSPVFVLGSGKILRPERVGTRTTLKEEAGLTPIVLGSSVSDGLWHARNGGPDWSVVAVSMGGMLYKRRWVEDKTFHLETGAVFPQDLSVDPSGRRAAIRYLSDLKDEKNALMVVDLEQWKVVYQGDLESAGAVLALSPTLFLTCTGNTIAVLDLSKPDRPEKRELLKLPGSAVERVLKMSPVVGR